ncbi:MAG TPA: hypothetical protein VNW92_26780 [Polyangiaceae bacterium]|nr:hypothetical protein [Polyangiaceae bacterium]
MQRLMRVALLGVALALAAAAGYARLQAHARAVPRQAVLLPSSSLSSSLASSAEPAVAPGVVLDPLSPGHPATVDSAARAMVGDWIRARPGFQYSRSAAERGGVEPCGIQALDTTALEAWAPLSRGHFVAPRDFGLDESGHFNLVLHFNGDEPVRREWIQSQAHFVLYTLTVEASQYAPLMSGSHWSDAIVAEIERALSKASGRTARAGHLALSAWSAGFVAIEAALAQPANDIDAVILIDGLHAPRGNDAAFRAQMQPFVDYAARAAEHRGLFVVSHSAIDPPDFASTTECAHYLIASLGGKPTPVRRADALGLELVEYFTRGDFHVRGYAGNDTADHCAQLAVLRDAYAALGRRWGSPVPSHR